MHFYLQYKNNSQRHSFVCINVLFNSCLKTKQQISRAFEKQSCIINGKDCQNQIIKLDMSGQNFIGNKTISSAFLSVVDYNKCGNCVIIPKEVTEGPSRITRKCTRMKQQPYPFFCLFCDWDTFFFSPVFKPSWAANFKCIL